MIMARKVAHIEEIDRHIGAKIQELRLASGMSRQQLGEKIEVTHQQLQKYERGTNRISAGRLAVIAKHLNKKVQYFFEDVEGNRPLEQDIDLSQNQRMCIEVSRNFMRIKSSKHKDAVNTLVRSLANVANENINTDIADIL
jgi:transcriptional regulator with XRE-family HTH domain